MNFLKFFLPVFFYKKFFRKKIFFSSTALERNYFGLVFQNPVGLAAGFDKNAKYLNELTTLGFGFVEIGTVTPVAQEGNAKPRLVQASERQGYCKPDGI